MSTHEKKLLAYGCFYASQFALLLAAMYVSEWFIPAFFANIFVSGALVNRIRCPRCDTPVTYRRTVLRFAVSKSSLGKMCEECGLDLSLDGK